MDPNSDEKVALQRFDWEWKNGSRVRAVELAKEYIVAGWERIAPALRGKGVEELVRLVDELRAAGRDDDRIVIDMWILSGCVDSTMAVGKVELPASAPGAVGNIAKSPALFAAGWAHGRRIEDKRESASRFVDVHRGELQALFGGYTLQQLVALCDVYREEKRTADLNVTEAWILAEYPPQEIVGELKAQMSPHELDAQLRAKRALQG